MTTAVRAEPRSFNRMAAQNASSDFYSFLTLGKLVRVNRATEEVEPWLAEKWETAADGRTFTFTLREARLVRRHALHRRRRPVLVQGGLRPKASLVAASCRWAASPCSVLRPTRAPSS